MLTSFSVSLDETDWHKRTGPGLCGEKDFKDIVKCILKVEKVLYESTLSRSSFPIAAKQVMASSYSLQ
ncbi:hypothetical protein J5N97_022333 [Dioscorea zingiberensis]|uniref:Uncharacterized protein n=1 Tax=Dioscorea zingiberensis TaxID=325984 RepID=A0A9D5C9V9_9LILI|nr:hypothetical protein J5N97_022333 [Dioscorea zingiberensis]